MENTTREVKLLNANNEGLIATIFLLMEKLGETSIVFTKEEIENKKGKVLVEAILIDGKVDNMEINIINKTHLK